MKAVSSVNRDNVRKFAQESIEPGQTLNTDALHALRVLTEEHRHIAKVTPSELEPTQKLQAVDIRELQCDFWYNNS